MRIRTLIGLAVAAAIALVLATPVSAQTPPPTPTPQTQARPPAPPPTQAQPPAPGEQARATQQLRSPVEGELDSVDIDDKKIKVKQASGPDLEFVYNDKTEISGAQKDAAGLATMKDAKVTVHFTEDAQTKARTATRVIVQPKS